ncbi:hypothetical protein PSA7680_02757 [Pseudoruegeria aquimaris]|uniref:Glycosyl transferase family 8 n=1 Tax=Pseudoruegeria aquimaris TaxID=393663 RepID=A0A1Y5T2H1_9RHOB|nr:hypothetical protein [Pseudoruegeria aquimaris]SLN52508.1 hypothetical protein PSA7680_02757 [Pseudoruegeria aquimaris]
MDTPGAQAARTAGFFMMDGTRYEPMAIYLAASLRHHHGDALALYAYVPAQKRAEVTPLTEKTLADLKVEIRDLPQPDLDGGIWKEPYPHGNKMLAALDDRHCDVSLFFDTDMVCVAPLELDGLVPEGAVAAMVSDYKTWGGKNRWQKAYGLFGLQVPEERVQFHRGQRLWSPPYFNAGFVGFREGRGADGMSFAEAWLDTARRIDFDTKLDGLRPFLDQVSLPVAIRRQGLAFEMLPRAYNLTIQNAEYDPDAQPRILHYHKPKYLKVWPQGAEAFEVCRRMVGDRRYGRLRARFKGFFENDLTGVQQSDPPGAAQQSG